MTEIIIHAHNLNLANVAQNSFKKFSCQKDTLTFKILTADDI